MKISSIVLLFLLTPLNVVMGSEKSQYICAQVRDGKYEICYAYHGTSLTLEQLSNVIGVDVHEQYTYWNGIGASCGLICTKGGRIGDGVYLTPQIETAESIAFHRWQQRPGTAKVVLGYSIDTTTLGAWKHVACMCNPSVSGVTDRKHILSSHSGEADILNHSGLEVQRLG